MIKDGYCAVCGGKVSKKNSTLDRIWKGKFYLFENVSVFACEECGEIWIPGRTAEWMDEVIQNNLKPRKKVLVPVY